MAYLKQKTIYGIIHEDNFVTLNEISLTHNSNEKYIFCRAENDTHIFSQTNLKNTYACIDKENPYAEIEIITFNGSDFTEFFDSYLDSSFDITIDYI